MCLLGFYSEIAQKAEHLALWEGLRFGALLELFSAKLVLNIHSSAPKKLSVINLNNQYQIFPEMKTNTGNRKEKRRRRKKKKSVLRKSKK